MSKGKSRNVFKAEHLYIGIPSDLSIAQIKENQAQSNLFKDSIECLMVLNNKQ